MVGRSRRHTLCRAQLDELGVAYSFSQIKLKASGGVSLASHKSIQCCITPPTSHSPPQDTCLTGRAKTTDEHERDEILLRTRWSVWSKSLAGLTDIALNGLDSVHQTFANLQTIEHLSQCQHSPTCIIPSNGMNVMSSYRQQLIPLRGFSICTYVHICMSQVKSLTHCFLFSSLPL